MLDQQRHMEHLEKLNSAIKNILVDPLNQDSWGDVFLSTLVISRLGYSFVLNVKIDLPNVEVTLVKFDIKCQLIFISEESRSSIIGEDHEFYKKLHAYLKQISKRETVVEETIKIYDMDYFVKHGKRIHYMLTNHPLIDYKIESIIKRYRKHSQK